MRNTILFIDDDQAVLNGLKRLLRNEKYEQIYTTDPEEAIILMKHEKIDVGINKS